MSASTRARPRSPATGGGSTRARRTPDRARFISCRNGGEVPTSNGTPEHTDRRVGMEKRFEGKVAFVTGAATGMGQAMAVRLASEGALVGVNHLPTVDPSETLKGIKDAGGEGFPVVADVRRPDQVVAMVQEVARRGGRLDYVVSNAGINPFMTWDNTAVEDFDALSETNFRGTWLVCTEGAKQMVKEGHGGAICCTSSLSAHVGSPSQVAYCGTKAGVSMLVKALGAVLGGHGIRINAIEPGCIDTPMAAPLLADPPALKYYLERIALHRIGKPEEMASIVAFLLSDDASYLTCSTILADAGFIVNAEL
ncbi:MAG: SDR family oxidoreductase [Chloroflexi bacterium]|nr:MAG: SDR family oxidoreductase [Chloroflexota bacterium]